MLFRSPQARAIHVGSAALGLWHPETVRRMARNQLLLAARHYSARHLWPVLVAQILWGAVAVRHGRGLAWARGKFQGLRLFSAARTQYQSLPDGRGSDQSRDRQGAMLEQILRSNEQFIRTASRDRYWKLYFLLTRGTM